MIQKNRLAADSREVAKLFKKLLEKETLEKKVSSQLVKIQGDIDLFKRLIKRQLGEGSFLETSLSHIEKKEN